MRDFSNIKRIIVIGSGGAGKTTLSLKLGEIAHLPVVHLDKLFWNGHWTHVEADEFDAALNAELAKEKWIIDGNFERTLETRLAHCDLAVYLDYSPLLCVLGVLKRVRKHYGTTRPDMGGDCPERYDLSFLKWVYTFRRKNRDKYLKTLAESGKNYIVLKNRIDCRRFCEYFSRFYNT